MDEGKNRTLLGGLCLAILSIVLVAGLWPFHAPMNEVTWVSRGLRFGRHGSAVSRNGFVENGRVESGETIEVLVEPDTHRHSGVLLSFDSPNLSVIPLQLRQVNDALVVQQANLDEAGYRLAWLPVHQAFQSDHAVFVAVTLAPHNTKVYLNGILAQSFLIQGSSSEALLGKLVLAASPNSADSWTGTMTGLAIYKQLLSPEQVSSDYQLWRGSGPAVTSTDRSPIAVYDFDEGSGDVVRNRVSSETDLTIPAHFFVLHPVFLRSPWRAYRGNWAYWQDVLVNIGGFIPLGFLFAACFAGRPRTTVTYTIAIGLATSLTIEVLQFLLPTRDSGATDLITNTLGTAVGALFCRSSLGQRVLENVYSFGRSTIVKSEKRSTNDVIVLQSDSFRRHYSK